MLSPVGPADLLPPDTDTSGMRKDGWVDAARRQRPSLAARPKNKFWFESLPESRVLYVQFNQVGNKDDETIEAFSKRLSAFIDSNAVDRVILDLRLNRGGNGSLNRPLIVALIRAARVDRPGGLFVLIGRSTWSAAQMLVNDLEQYTDAIFVGEPTGARSITTATPGGSRSPTAASPSASRHSGGRATSGTSGPGRRRTSRRTDVRGLSREPGPGARSGARLHAGEDAGGFARRNGIGDGPVTRGCVFAAWKADPRHAWIDPELQLNLAGYRLLAEKRIPEAIQVFRLAAEASPQSANAFDSLGEAQAAAGDKEAAIRSYEKALSLDPKLDSARDALAKLRAPGPS